MPADEVAAKALERELDRAYCQSNTWPTIKCPRSDRLPRAELPRHPTGKLYKRLLKDRYWGNRDSRIV